MPKMIRAKVFRSSDRLCGLEVKGHANYDHYGQDVVCASVSSIITGGFNAFDDKEIKEISLKEGLAKIKIVESDSAVLKLQVIITQLETLKQVYPQNITIENERRCKK